MPATPTYSPILHAFATARTQLATTCRYARYAETHPVQPLKGHQKPRAVSVSYRASVPAGHVGCGLALSYRAASPGGARLPFRITATHTLAKQSSDHCPHTYGVRHLSCAPIATEPCRPTTCGGEHPCCTVAYTTTANYSLLTANSSFTFSAKERDPETGLSYFGSRYYSSDLSIWLSVDPQSDKYASLSPYTYCADNPVKLVDPNGEEIWKPEITETGDIRLLFEEGDSYQSLTHFLGGKSGIFSKRQIDKMWKNRDDNGNVTLSKNIFSKAIKKAMELNYPSEEDIMKYKDWAAAERAGYTKNYNCIGSAISAAMGEEIGYRFIEKLDEDLEYGKWYSTNVPVFGKTLLRFEHKGKATHAAIYFGQDHSGNTYVFTKNGPFPAPKIMLLQDVENIPGYGTVTPLRTNTKRLQGDSGMYNYGRKKK